MEHCKDHGPIWLSYRFVETVSPLVYTLRTCMLSDQSVV